MTYPERLFVVGGRQSLTNRIGIVERPCRQLLQYSDLCEDIEVVELVRLLVGAKGVAMWRLRNELSPGVLIKNVQPVIN